MVRVPVAGKKWQETQSSNLATGWGIRGGSPGLWGITVKVRVGRGGRVVVVLGEVGGGEMVVVVGMTVVEGTVEVGGEVILVAAGGFVTITLVGAGVLGIVEVVGVAVVTGGCELVVAGGLLTTEVVFVTGSDVDGVVPEGAGEPQPGSNKRPATQKYRIFDMRMFYLQLL
jgi:hypothetical protein